MSTTSYDTPVSLLERIKAGDQEDWTEFARKYISVLQQWCGKRKIQDSDSQDVVQYTSLAVLKWCVQFSAAGQGQFSRLDEDNCLALLVRHVEEGGATTRSRSSSQLSRQTALASIYG